MSTHVRQENGKPQIAASWYAGVKGSAWWLRLTTDVVLSDGTSRSKARLRQVGDAYVAWPIATLDQPCRTIPEKYRDQVSLSFDFQLTNLLIEKLTGEENATADYTKPDVLENIRKNAIKNFPGAKVPDWLADVAAAPLLDLRQAVSLYGIKLGPDDLMALDPDSFLVIRASKDAATLELLNSVFTGLCGGKRNDVNYQTWLESADQPGEPFTKISITSIAGARSEIDWSDPSTSTKIFMRQEFSVNLGGKLESRSEHHCKTRNHDGKKFEWNEKVLTKLDSDQTDMQELKNSPQDPVIKKFQKAYVSPEW